MCGFTDVAEFPRAHREWVEHALNNGQAPRDDRWSEAIAVGSLPFVEKIKSDLGFRVTHREASQASRGYHMRERAEAYAGEFTSENVALTLENTIPSNENVETAET